MKTSTPFFRRSAIHLVLVLCAACGAEPLSTGASTDGVVVDSDDTLAAALRGSWDYDGGGPKSGLILLGNGKEGAFHRDLEGNHAEGTYAVDFANKRIVFNVTVPRSSTQVFSLEWQAGQAGGRPPTLAIQPLERMNAAGDMRPFGDRTSFNHAPSWCMDDTNIPDLGVKECFAAYKDGAWGETRDNQTFTPITIEGCTGRDADTAKSCLKCDVTRNRCMPVK